MMQSIGIFVINFFSGGREESGGGYIGWEKSEDEDVEFFPLLPVKMD